jgi:hypothetical protein
VSARVDAERRADRRHAAVARAGGILSKLERLLKYYDEGMTDGDIGCVLGWSAETVMRYRQVLQLSLGRPMGGRWRDAVRRERRVG